MKFISLHSISKNTVMVLWVMLVILVILHIHNRGISENTLIIFQLFLPIALILMCTIDIPGVRPP